MSSPPAIPETGKEEAVNECSRDGCGQPIPVPPVTPEYDPAGRVYCSDECLDAVSEAAYEQIYKVR